MAQAQEAIGYIDWNMETLTGDWSGERSRLSERGINLEALLKGDLVANLDGGMKRGHTYMQNLEFMVGLDGSKLVGIPNSSIYIHVLTHQGGQANGKYTGSWMGVDNLEVDDKTPKLFQAWFNQDLLDSSLSLLVGVYPIDTEFYVNDASGVFLHPSFGPGAEMAQTGVSIYPLSSLGLRVKYQPRPTLYAQAAILDADTGSGEHPSWASPDRYGHDGAFLIFEAGYRPGESHHVINQEPLSPEVGTLASSAQRIEERFEPVGKYAIGLWSYTEQSERLDTGSTLGRLHNQGAYLLMEHSLYRSEDLSRDLSLFFRYGIATPEVNSVASSTSFGLRLRGPFKDRVADVAGLAWTRSNTSREYRRLQASEGTPVDDHEAVIEATYRYQYSPWLAIQPSLQRVINPGFDPAIKDATLLGVRLELLI